MQKEFISVVIPAFNEESRILPTILKIWEYLRIHFEEFEIIVVDDGSSDNTASVVKSLAEKMGNIRLLSNGVNKGKGFSIKQGVLASSGNVILITDADLSTPIEESEKLFIWLDRGFDVVIGSRGMRESEIAVRQPWWRERMGRIFNILVRTLVIGGFKDTQCGFKLFRGDVAREVFRKSMIKRFSFDVEILFIAKKKGFSIKEVPVRWLNSPDSRVRVFNDSISMITDLLEIRLNWIRGIYG